MRKQNYFLASIMLLGAVCFSSCSKDTPIADDVPQLENSLNGTQKELVGIPYAKESDLKTFSSDDNIIDYKFSREVALIDLQDFKNDLYKDNQNLSLSDFPVIVYDNDNKPKYYEFIVSNNGKDIGTITCFAKKEVPDFTAYVLPFVRDYSDKRAVKYTSAYPQISEQDNNTSLTSRKVISDEELKIQQEAKSFWGNIGDETELLTAKNTNTTGRFIEAWNEYYTIPRFDREDLKRTRWGGWCGPAALAWLYRAHYPYYKGVYYPLHGDNYSASLGFYPDSEHDNVSKYYYEKSPLYKDLADLCRVNSFPKGATLSGDLISAVNSIFPDYKLVSGTKYLLGNARQSIEKNIPTILLTYANNEPHYLVGFGTKNRYNRYHFWFFKTSTYHTDSWIYVSDNGATTRSNGCLPYYMNSHAIIGQVFITYQLIRK